MVGVNDGVHPILMIAPLLLYLLDTGRTLVFRAVRRLPLMSAHRDHVYQKLSDQMGHTRTTLTVAAFTVGITGLGWLMTNQAQPVSGIAAVSLVALGIAYVALPRVWSWSGGGAAR